MKRKFLYLVIPILLLFGLITYGAPLLWAAPQNVVVGDGTPESCNNNTLGAALTADGVVTFNCGPNPHIIIADTYVINHAITIDGADLITVDGENLRQLFLVQSGAALTLNKLTLTQGNWSGNGGAIVNYGTLTLNHTIVRDSRAEGEGAAGGAIFNDGGVVTLNDSQLLNNSATAVGGGLENRRGVVTLNNSTVRGNQAASYAGLDNSGTMVVQHSIIAENRATTDYGGGIGINGGEFTLQDSTVAANRADQAIGGGIAAINGVTTIERSQIQDNVGAWGGGGLYVNPNYEADVTVRDSTITRNATTAQEEPIRNPNAFGGGIYGSRNLTLERVTVSGNIGGAGGGLFYYQNVGALIVRDSTISGNVATAVGGGLWLSGGSHTLTNVTVSNNAAQNAYGGGLVNDGVTQVESATFYGNAAAAGDNVVNRGQLTLHNTILAAPARAGVNCGGENWVAIASAGYNLVSDESCALTAMGDQQGIDPQVGPLTDNGGSTQTHLPQPDSPAIDKGDNCPTTDQRGFARPAGVACDIGAVETDAEPSAPTATPTVMPTATPTIPPTNTPFPVTPIPTLVTNYALTAVEVTQGIQDLQNSVPLIRGKAAWVRAHVKRTTGNHAPAVSAQLWRIVNGARSGDPIYPSNPSGKLIPLNTPNRSQLNDAFYFPVPAAWLNASTLQVEVEVNPQVLNRCNLPRPFCLFYWWRVVDETSYSDNILRSSLLNLQSVPPLRLQLYNVVYGKKVGNTTNWYQANNTQLFEIEDWLRRAYPIAALNSRRSETTLTEAGIYRWVKDAEGKDVYQLQAGLVNQRLELVRNIDQAFNPAFSRQARYYGLVTDASGDFMRGLGGGFIASGPTGNVTGTSWAWWDTDSGSYGDWYAGHEIGHTWNRWHPVAGGYVSKEDPGCGHSRDDTNYPYPNAVIGGKNQFIPIGIGNFPQWLILPPDRYYGFDIFLRGPVVYGPDWTDMMSYCDKQWISDYTYNAIRTQMQSEGLVQAAQAMGPAGEYAMIQGAFSDDLATAKLDTILHIPSPVGQPLPEPGAFAIHLRDANNNLLASYPFTPTVYEDADDHHAYYLNVFVPYPAGVQKIEVRKGDQVLDSRTVSAHAPNVTVITPNGGETVGEAGVTAAWSMSDADGDPLSATVLFSANNGQSWQTLAVNITDTQVALSYAALPGTTQGRLRVLVTDGVNTIEDQSDAPFTIAQHAPQAAILAPAANATFVVSQTVLLHGSGYDVEDGLLPDSAFVWQSDRDGVLGTGSELAINTLSAGTHVITLRVTDSANQTTTANRTIIVGADLTTAPSILAVAPQTIQFSAIVGSTAQPTLTLALRDSNAATGVTTPLTWNAATDAPWLALDQNSGSTPSDIRLSAAPVALPVGVYTATVTVTASNGNRQSVPVQLEVLPTSVVPTTGTALYLPLIRR